MTVKKSRAEHGTFDHLLFSYIGVLLAGLVVVYSASSVWSEARHGSHFYLFQKQFIAALLSLAAIWVIGKVDLERISVYSAPALMLTILMLSLVFIMPAVNGSQRWLRIGSFSVQPSELFKFVMIFYLAFSLANPRRNLANLKHLLFPYLPLIGVGLFLILAEPDLGTTVVVFLTAVILFFLAGARIKHLLAALLPLAGIGSFVVFVLGYKKARVLDYIAALGDPLQGSHQAKQAALALGSGGLFGTGLGDGRQKLFFLPYPHTDFVFAAIGEEIGFFGLMIIMGLLFYILYRGMRIAHEQPDKFGYLLAAGMTMSLFVNIAINLGVVTSLLPVTGLALPFFSYGGSSLLVSSAMIGVLLNLSRRSAGKSRRWKKSA